MDGGEGLLHLGTHGVPIFFEDPHPTSAERKVCSSDWKSLFFRSEKQLPKSIVGSKTPRLDKSNFFILGMESQIPEIDMEGKRS